MRVLLLCHAFNSLSQRLYVELVRWGHEVMVELDISDALTEEAVRLSRPDLILAPYLRRAIPESVWGRHLCLVVHPGPVGDRGPSSLDWAILSGAASWGVTLLQANGVLDGGPTWATRPFPMRAAPKGSLYRREVTEAAVACVGEALEKRARGGFAPEPPPAALDAPRPAMKQAERRIDWATDGTDEVLRKLHSGDGQPGVLERVLGVDCFLYDAHAEGRLRGEPGAVLATRLGAICLATRDGAVWVTQLRERAPTELPFKRSASAVLGARLDGVPQVSDWTDLRFEQSGLVGHLWFPFYNGAMSSARCRRLQEAFGHARRSGAKVLVLHGGEEHWSNGIDLNTIEAAESPADESLANIEAMDDLCRDVLEATDVFVVAALAGNAGAGGVFFALCADSVVARDGVVLNPHYKNMGNLYGSEYWTYVLPRRLGEEGARALMARRLPVGAQEAAALGLIDAVFPSSEFDACVTEHAERLALDAPALTSQKAARRVRDEAERPLAAYREAELARMRLNFYGFDPSYHVARYHFVHKTPSSWTPLHLATHRRR